VTCDVLARFRALHDAEERLAMATLVSAEGTSSSIVGAKTFVGGTGHIVGSVTIGGCIDARAVEAADRVLGTGRSELLDVALADEDAWDMGLGCGGTVRLLVERVAGGAAADPAASAYARAEEAVRAGMRALVIRPLDGDGARMVVLDDGSRSGTLGDEARDARVSGAATARGTTGVVHDPDGGAAYFVERFAPAHSAVIFGAGEVAVVLSRIVRDVQMRAVIVDARPRYATAERFPEADEIRIGDPGVIAAGLPGSATTLVVVVSHDYKYELPVLREVLRAPVGYIGLMSSRKRGENLRAVLRDEGFSEAELQRIRTPIGVEIGARSPAEVAVAIGAELVAVRAAQRRAT
jgi:xanthine dehydrogenase accessory factor